MMASSSAQRRRRTKIAEHLIAIKVNPLVLLAAAAIGSQFQEMNRIRLT